MALFSRPSQWLYVEGTCHEVGHTWVSSCILANIDISFCVFYEGFKLYLPLYLVCVSGMCGEKWQALIVWISVHVCVLISDCILTWNIIYKARLCKSATSLVLVHNYDLGSPFSTFLLRSRLHVTVEPHRSSMWSVLCLTSCSAPTSACSVT